MGKTAKKSARRDTASPSLRNGRAGRAGRSRTATPSPRVEQPQATSTPVVAATTLRVYGNVVSHFITAPSLVLIRVSRDDSGAIARHVMPVLAVRHAQVQYTGHQPPPPVTLTVIVLDGGRAVEYANPHEQDDAYNATALVVLPKREDDADTAIMDICERLRASLTTTPSPSPVDCVSVSAAAVRDETPVVTADPPSPAFDTAAQAMAVMQPPLAHTAH